MTNEALREEIKNLEKKIELQGQDIVRLNVKVEMFCKKIEKIESLLEDVKGLIDGLKVKPGECDRRFDGLEKTQRWVATSVVGALLLGFWDLFHMVIK